jgi:hypothetical protein
MRVPKKKEKTMSITLKKWNFERVSEVMKPAYHRQGIKGQILKAGNNSDCYRVYLPLDATIVLKWALMDMMYFWITLFGILF